MTSLKTEMFILGLGLFVAVVVLVQVVLPTSMRQAECAATCNDHFIYYERSCGLFSDDIDFFCNCLDEEGRYVSSYEGWCG